MLKKIFFHLAWLSVVIIFSCALFEPPGKGSVDNVFRNDPIFEMWLGHEFIDFTDTSSDRTFHPRENSSYTNIGIVSNIPSSFTEFTFDIDPVVYPGHDLTNLYLVLYVSRGTVDIDSIIYDTVLPQKGFLNAPAYFNIPQNFEKGSFDTNTHTTNVINSKDGLSVGFGNSGLESNTDTLVFDFESYTVLFQNTTVSITNVKVTIQKHSD